MQWKHWNLDCECKEKRECDPEQCSAWKISLSKQQLQSDKVEASGSRVDPENGDQQWRRWDEREEEEPERGFGSVFAAVHGDQDSHRHKRKFPEAVVEHEIERYENAHHCRLLNEKQRIKNLTTFLDRIPTDDNADGRKQADKNYEPDTETIDTDVIVDGWVFNPGNIDFKLEARLSRLKVCRQVQREQQAN